MWSASEGDCPYALQRRLELGASGHVATQSDFHEYCKGFVFTRLFTRVHMDEETVFQVTSQSHLRIAATRIDLNAWQSEALSRVEL
jgi:hypothetical protein